MPFLRGLLSKGLRVARPLRTTDLAGEFSILGSEMLERRILLSAKAIGAELQVDTPTGLAEQTATAMHSDGSFVVAWSSRSSIRVQRFDPAGERTGAEFQTATSTEHLANPRVLMDASGNFIICWIGYDDAFGNRTLFAERFSAAGARSGTRFTLASAGPNTHLDYDLALLPDNGFALIWTRQSYSSGGIVISNLSDPDVAGTSDFVPPSLSVGDDGGPGVYMQRYTASGTPRGPVIQLRSSDGFDHVRPRIASNSMGVLAVVWQQYREDFGRIDGDSFSIRARVFDSDLQPLSTEFQANSGPGVFLESPDVGIRSDGALVVTWNSPNHIFARYFGPDAVPQTAEFQVSSSVGAYLPAVTMAPGGEFIITWHGSPGNLVAFQRFDSDGSADGPQTQLSVENSGSGLGSSPSVAFDSNGDHVIAWSHQGIHAQRFEANYGPGAVVIGQALGGPPRIRVFDGELDTERFRLAPYPGLHGSGVSLAAADLNGDGLPEIITGPGPGGGPLVRVFDGATGVMLNQFFAFGQAFHGGINVATGDVDGDGSSEVIVAPRAHGGPAIRVFDGLTGAQMGDTIWAFGRAFFGGVNVAAGDIDGNGTYEIIAGAGPGGGPAFRIFDGSTGAQVGETTFAFAREFVGGLVVTAGDLDGDNLAELIVGPQTGSPWDSDGDLQASFIVIIEPPRMGPRVRVFDAQSRVRRSDFSAFDPAFHEGLSLATGDIDADGQREVIAGAGPGGRAAVRAFDGLAGTQVGDTLFAFGTGFRGGVVVAGVVPPFLTGSSLTIQSTTPAEEDAPVLTSGQLSPVIAAATARLHETALSTDLLAGLSSTQFVVTDLPGDLLGLAQRGRIYLDNDAAGYGWFVDYSPLLDEEFSSGSDRLVAIDGRAAGRIDLLSVVLHELGHALGLDHADAAHPDALMSATLQPGVRRSPSAADLDALFEREQAWDLIAV